MRKRFLSLMLSLIMVSTISIGALDNSYAIENSNNEDFNTSLKNDKPIFDSSILTDNIDIKEAPKNPLFFNNRSADNSDENFGLKQDPLKVHTNYDALDKDDKISDRSAGERYSDNLPAHFDLREHNRSTPVRNQGPNGSCWAFATYGSAESVLLPEKNMDFSEKNLRNTHGFDWGPKDGGTASVAAAYLSRWSGPILEQDEPYSPYDFTSPSYVKPAMELDKAIYVPDIRSGYDVTGINRLKRAIIDYGASYTTVYGSNNTVNFNTMGHYTTQGWANHAVTIIGWDDNYSAYNFKYAPPGNGAWIVKNSWGPNWGSKGGYFYVSYYDNVMGRNNCIFVLKNKNRNKEIWYYDTLGMTSNIGNGSTGWFSNVYGPVDKESKISEVGVFVPSNNTKYEVYLNTNVTNNSGLNDRVKVAEGTIKYAGYTTIKFNPQRIEKGAYFSPIVKFTTDGYSYPIPIETPINGYSSRARAYRGQSYISYDGVRWSDLTSQMSNTNVCLKAFTEHFDGGSNDNSSDKVESISINPSDLSLRIGQEKTLEAIISPYSAKDKKVIWKSLDNSVATVSTNGVVLGISKGTTKIVAISNEDSSITSSINVRVGYDNLSDDIFLVNSSLSSNEIRENENLNLKVNVTDRYKRVLKYAKVTVNIDGNSSTEKYVYTDDRGNAVFDFDYSQLGNIGRHNINISVSGGKYEVNNSTLSYEIIDNSVKVKSITLYPKNLELKIGEIKKISSRILPEIANNKELNWSSSDNRIATVDKYGNVKAISSGRVNIVATSTDGSNVYSSSTVTVVNNSNNQNIFLVKTSMNSNSIKPDDDLIVKVNVRDKYNRVLKYASVQLIIDSDSSTVRNAYTDNYGNAEFKYDETFVTGQHSLNIKVYGGNFVNYTESIDFMVLDDDNTVNENIITTVEKDSDVIYSNESINFNIKTDSGSEFLSNVKYDITITDSNGNEFKDTGKTDYYGKSTYTFTPKSEVYGIYKLRIDTSKDGYEDSFVETYFTVKEKINNIDFSIKSDKDRYVLGDMAHIDLSLLDASNNGLRYKTVYVNITGPNNYRKTFTKRTNYYGKFSLYFQPKFYDKAGIYNIEFSTSPKGYGELSKNLQLEFSNDKPLKPMNITINTDKEIYNYGDNVVFNIFAKDGGLSINKVNVNLQFLNNGNVIYEKDYITGYNGKVTLRTSSLEDGEYTLKVKASKDSFITETQEYKVKINKNQNSLIDSEDEEFNKEIENNEALNIINNNKLNDNFVILDVRNYNKYYKHHIENAINYNIYSLGFNSLINKLDKNKTYLVYGRARFMSSYAAKRLSKAGFKKVYWLNGGIIKWIADNNPVTNNK